MDRLLAPNTYEAEAFSRLSENWFMWDTDHPSLNETLLAGCASYQAFQRYLTGADLYIRPRNRSELESILRRYATDAIHNAISQARSYLQPGGYSRTLHLAEKSIVDVLSTNDNADHLLHMHWQEPAQEQAHSDAVTTTSEPMERPPSAIPA